MISLSQTELPSVVAAAAQGAADLKADEIVVLDVGDVLGITDHFVIASGQNNRQVRRIAEEIEAAVKAVGGEGSRRAEGVREGSWILLDFGPFVAHIFHHETRAFYNIEQLWSDVPRVDWVDEPPQGQSGESRVESSSGQTPSMATDRTG